jgi:hypothetical protein
MNYKTPEEFEDMFLSFPHLWHITGSVTRITWRAPLVEQKLDSLQIFICMLVWYSSAFRRTAEDFICFYRTVDIKKNSENIRGIWQPINQLFYSIYWFKDYYYELCFKTMEWTAETRKLITNCSYSIPSLANSLFLR